MAFVTMIFAYMVIAGVIALVIAGTISTIGLIVLIISLIRRHRAKVRGEKPKKIWFDYRVDFVFAANICSYWFYSLLVCLNIELVEVEIMLDQIIKNCLDQMQEFVNGVIFLISFLALRRRTGGFHMKTFKACYVATIGTFIGVLLVKNIMYTK